MTFVIFFNPVFWRHKRPEDSFSENRKPDLEAEADALFSQKFVEMTDEIDRVAKEKVTIFGRLVSWIYFKIFGNAEHVKRKQDTSDKLRSAKAFGKMKQVFEPIPDNSMKNEDIIDFAERKF